MGGRPNSIDKKNPKQIKHKTQKRGALLYEKLRYREQKFTPTEKTKND